MDIKQSPLLASKKAMTTMSRAAKVMMVMMMMRLKAQLRLTRRS
jgi:hypothetical protein